jgi:hypothetical protein
MALGSSGAWLAVSGWEMYQAASISAHGGTGGLAVVVREAEWASSHVCDYLRYPWSSRLLSDRKSIGFQAIRILGLEARGGLDGRGSLASIAASRQMPGWFRCGLSCASVSIPQISVKRAPADGGYIQGISGRWLPGIGGSEDNLDIEATSTPGGGEHAKIPSHSRVDPWSPCWSKRWLG